jgi:hypothetical protein
LKAFEDVVVDLDAVALLAGDRAQLRQSRESLRLRFRVVKGRRGANQVWFCSTPCSDGIV